MSTSFANRNDKNSESVNNEIIQKSEYEITALEAEILANKAVDAVNALKNDSSLQYANSNGQNEAYSSAADALQSYMFAATDIQSQIDSDDATEESTAISLSNAEEIVLNVKDAVSKNNIEDVAKQLKNLLDIAKEDFNFNFESKEEPFFTLAFDSGGCSDNLLLNVFRGSSGKISNEMLKIEMQKLNFGSFDNIHKILISSPNVKLDSGLWEETSSSSSDATMFRRKIENEIDGNEFSSEKSTSNIESSVCNIKLRKDKPHSLIVEFNGNYSTDFITNECLEAEMKKSNLGMFSKITVVTVPSNVMLDNKTWTENFADIIKKSFLRKYVQSGIVINQDSNTTTEDKENKNPEADYRKISSCFAFNDIDKESSGFKLRRGEDGKLFIEIPKNWNGKITDEMLEKKIKMNSPNFGALNKNSVLFVPSNNECCICLNNWEEVSSTSSRFHKFKFRKISTEEKIQYFSVDKNNDELYVYVDAKNLFKPIIIDDTVLRYKLITGLIGHFSTVNHIVISPAHINFRINLDEKVWKEVIDSSNLSNVKFTRRVIKNNAKKDVGDGNNGVPFFYFPNYLTPIKSGGFGVNLGQNSDNEYYEGILEKLRENRKKGQQPSAKKDIFDNSSDIKMRKNLNEHLQYLLDDRKRLDSGRGFDDVEDALTDNAEEMNAIVINASTLFKMRQSKENMEFLNEMKKLVHNALHH
ncbi:hypothetical protein FACS189465_0310 [Clostridia bacterium]|nr:hypothetical protein FACS189465_0310 [Clostridia bacterium]